MRRFSPVEIAIGFSLLGSIAAIAIPTFARDFRASRFVEPTDGLARIGKAAVAYAEVNGRFPESSPLTPVAPPRGKMEADPPETWETPTWQALGFQPSAPGVAHAYAFAFDAPKPEEAFVATAHGDLDGDGLFSTFELKGVVRPGPEGAKPEVLPGMYVEAELE